MTKFRDYSKNWVITQKQALLQDSMSSEINAKLSNLNRRGRVLAKLADEYNEMTDDELFLHSEYYQQKMNEIEAKFLKLGLEFHRIHDNLTIINSQPIFLN